MKGWITLAMIVAGLGTSGMSLANGTEQSMTHREFMRGCRAALYLDQSGDAGDIVRAAACLQYVRGVMDGLGAVSPVSIRGLKFCQANTTTPVLSVVKRMVAQDAEAIDQDGITDRVAVLTAMVQLARCQGD